MEPRRETAGSAEEPIWAVAIDRFLQQEAENQAGAGSEGVGQRFLVVLQHLADSGVAIDFGVLQARLREQDSPVQLLATPLEDDLRPGTTCEDPLTGELRHFQVNLAVGRTLAGEHRAHTFLAERGRPHWLNEAWLSQAGIMRFH